LRIAGHAELVSTVVDDWPDDCQAFAMGQQTGSLKSAEFQLVRHSHQVGNRGGIHLPHHLAAMHLGRDFTDSELVGNFFVRKSICDQVQYFPLARRELVKSRFQRGKLGASDPLGTVMRQGLLNRF
jgi:hypothetical protein